MNDEQLRKLEHLVNDTRLTKHQIARELGISFNSLVLYMERRGLRIGRVLIGQGTRAAASSDTSLCPGRERPV